MAFILHIKCHFQKFYSHWMSKWNIHLTMTYWNDDSFVYNGSICATIIRFTFGKCMEFGSHFTSNSGDKDIHTIRQVKYAIDRVT